MSMISRTFLRLVAGASMLWALAAPSSAQPLAEASLEIRGMSLEIVDTLVDLNLGSPGVVQTSLGGSTNDDAPSIDGFVAEGDLIGPGLAAPITLRTAPGHVFSIPGLSEEGEYVLQNVRLTSEGRFVAPAVPSVARIRVSNTLKTEVSVRQLTAEELRRRGIVVDARNFDVYEYTFTFYVDGKTVEVPYPVIIDPRTREVFPVATEVPYPLPGNENLTPPRFTPPTTVPFDLGVEPGELPPASSSTPGAPPPSRPSIPAALVIPSNLAVLHQFFGVAIVVTNGAPTGSQVRLDSVDATIRTPDQLRIAGSEPSVAFGRAVPIEGPDGTRFLVAQAQGKAEWTVEGLRPGTYSIDVDVRATMLSPGQPDLPLKGTKSASVVIHDPRFNVTFSHPSTVEATLDASSDANAYSAFAFITNMSPNEQTVVVDSRLLPCGTTVTNVCLAGGNASETLTLDAGELRTIEYRLKSNRSGTLFASSTSGSGDNLEIGFVVRDGQNGSPATLVMPWYARYLDPAFVNANLELLGRGYAIATTPLTQSTALRPRVIRTDVFRRAVDIARAGQRVFITTADGDADSTREGARFAFSNLALELLGARDGRRTIGNPGDHPNALREWDQLRRTEASGRTSGRALARQIERTFGPTDNAAAVFDRFTEANAHRSDFVAAMVGGGNARISFVNASGETLGVNDAGSHDYRRGVPFSDIHRLTLPDGSSVELGLVGSLASDVTLVIEATGPFDLDLVYPGGALGAPLRLSHHFGDLAPHTFRLHIVNGRVQIDSSGGDPAPLLTGEAVRLPAHSIISARQDLYLDPEGHKVSLLFNRPVSASDDLRDVFDGEVVFVDGSVSYRGPRPISAAALQDDGRILNLTFDHGLHGNVARRPGCSYTIRMAGAMNDPVTGLPVLGIPVPTPRIDNARPAALVLGRVIAGDMKPVSGADVILWAGPPQYDRSSGESPVGSAGTFLFEYVPLSSGTFTLEGITPDGKQTALSGTVRKDGQLYLLDLQFLGRGGARGFVRDAASSAPVEGARVVVSNRLFGGFRSATTDARGFYEVSDLPVGPVTFVATDEDGNVTYASNEIAVPGQYVEQDLVIRRATHPGFGTVRGLVRRSDDGSPIAGAHVAAFSQGYGLVDGYTDGAGRFEFTGVPAGFVTVLAEEWTVAWQSAALDFDLTADEIRDVSLTLMVRSQGQTFVRVEGMITKSGVGVPATPVPGALVLIDGLQVVTADQSGRYVYESVPDSFTGRRIRAHDPVSGRQVESLLPTLVSGTSNNVPLHIEVDSGPATGTIRAVVLDATGARAGNSEIKVVAKGIGELNSTSEFGAFEMTDVAVGRSLQLFAVPLSGTGRLGDQVASTVATVGFAGQVVSVTLRLPGQGRVDVSLVSEGVRQLGEVRVGYKTWSEVEEELVYTERLPLSTVDPPGSGLAGYAHFEKVPVGQTIVVEADLDQMGSASAERRLTYEGEFLQVDLQLGNRASVSGRVVNFDGITPIEGAIVAIEDGRQEPGTQTTGIDGTFKFADVPADAEFQLVSDWSRDGIQRKGTASGHTPPYGGKVEDVVVTLMRRADVRGRVVWADKQVDPADPTKLVPDTTPGVYTDNAPVSRASFYLRELEFPSRSFGSESSPLKAATDGSFVVANVMEGPFRVSASSGDFRGNATGSITIDGEIVDVLVVIGADGSGELEVSVRDPDNGFTGVPSAEVRLFRDGKSFDVGSTDGAGHVNFAALPGSGSYTVSAYSKALGRSGSSVTGVSVVPDSRVYVDVLLEVSGSVRGTLTDASASGAGVIGAHVDLDASGYRTRSTTGDGGAFVFDGIREGTFRLETRDPLSNRRASGQGQITRLDQEEVVDLVLPPWSSLRARVFLPDDGGNSSGALAPLVRAEVRQLCRRTSYSIEPVCDELQSAEGNDLVFAKLLEGPYTLVVQELGGGGRTLKVEGELGRGEAITRDLVLGASGPVRVWVVEQSTGSPMRDVKVSVYGGGQSFNGYTDANGAVTAPAMPVGAGVTAYAVTVDGLLSGRATGTVISASTPLELTIGLQSLASVTGYVQAETGGPSIGTAVAIGNASTVTGGDGRFELGGFVTGSSLTITYFGPNGTVGARQTFTPTRAGANEAAPVLLDSSPPRILAIVPDNGVTEVALDTNVEVKFSEPIAPQYLTTSAFRLQASGASTPVAASFTTRMERGEMIVTLDPAQDLAKHQLYTIVVSGSITDLAGHPVGVDRGSAFTTADQSAPLTIAVRPDMTRPVPVNSVIEIEFNEALEKTDWPVGGVPAGPAAIGSMKLYRIHDGIEEFVTGEFRLDEGHLRTLYFAPDAPLLENSRYRLDVSGVRDSNDNRIEGTVSYTFRTADEVPPAVRILEPVVGEPLVAGLFYTTRLELLDSGTSAAAPDIEKVDYFQQIDGGAWQFARTIVKSASNPGCSWSFAAPASVAAFGLRAIATDTSSNPSEPFDVVYTVVPDSAPSDVAIATTAGGTPVTAVYPGSSIVASLSFDEAGLSATYQMSAVATEDGATVFTAQSRTGELVRQQGSQWPEVTYTFTLPKTLAADAIVTVSARVTDSAGLVGSGETTIAILRDTGRPIATVISPATGEVIRDGHDVPILVKASDAEVGVRKVRAVLESSSDELARNADGDYEGMLQAPDVSGTAPVSYDVVVEAEDYEGNVSEPAVVSISVSPVDDPTDPVITVVCGTEGAVLPIGVNFDLIVDVRRGPDAGAAEVTEVVITVGGVAVSYLRSMDGRYVRRITTEGLSNGDVIDIRVDAKTGGSGKASASWQIPVVAAVDLTGVPAIVEGDPTWDKQSIFIRGGELLIDGPHTFENVIVLGGTIKHTATTTSKQRALDLKVANLFVARGATIDASAAGYVGTAYGIAYSWPNAGNGASGGSHGSHGGYGGLGTNQGAVYGSPVWPREPGAAGSGTCCNRSTPGGGVVRIEGSSVVVDGSILSNGGSDTNGSGGGAGGSILVEAASFAGGLDASIVARGALAAGGGRIAVHTAVPDRFKGSLRAAGGPGSASSDGTWGGAGTIYLREGIGVEEKETLIVGGEKDEDRLVKRIASLSSLGEREVDTSTWPQVDFTTSLPRWIEGSRVECSRQGAVVGDWRIMERVDDDSVTLEGAAPAVPLSGATCRGYWKFDTVIVRDGGRYLIGDASVDRFEGTPKAWVQASRIANDKVAIAGVVRATGEVHASTITVENGGRFEPSTRVEANDVEVAAGGVLSHMATPESGTDWPLLDLVVANMLQVDGAIDVSGKGFRGSEASRGRTWPNATTNGSYAGAGGSHGGRGSGSSGLTFGSVTQPTTPGGAGSRARDANQDRACAGEACSGGGGVIRINAGSIEVAAGARIAANGTTDYRQGGGAGGSILIRAGALIGDGIIEANGAPSSGYSGTTAGGGGRIAIESLNIGLTSIRASRGGSAESAGTVVTRASSSEPGVLTIDNTNGTPAYPTELPSLGAGVALAGSTGATLVTNRASIPPYFIGHWVEVRSSTGVEKGSWQVVAIDGGTLTLSSGAMVEPTDLWQGAYQFEDVRLMNGAKIWSVDPIRAAGFESPVGTLALANGQSSSVLAGSVVEVTATGSDTRGLTKIARSATGPVATGTEARNVSGLTTTQQFQLTVSSTAQPGDVVTIFAELFDEIGTRTLLAPVAVQVIADTIVPTIDSITFTPSSVDNSWPSATPLTMSVAASDNVGVVSVSFEVDGDTWTDTTAPYSLDWTTPIVMTETQSAVVVIASDAAGNEHRETKLITVIPADGGAVPQLTWTCPSASVPVPAGRALHLGVSATDDANVIRIELYEEGAAAPFHVANVSGASASAETTVIVPSTPGPVRYLARAYDVSPVYAESTIELDATSVVEIDTSSPDWSTLASTPGVLVSGTLVVNDPKELAGLFVMSGARVTHDPVRTTIDTRAVNLTINGPLFVECGGSIESFMKGYPANTTYPGEIVAAGSGASHIGLGGAADDVAPGGTYGSIYRPMEPGSAVSGGLGGGGVIRLIADSMHVDGRVSSSAFDHDLPSPTPKGDAGGSVWLTTARLSGVGEISADGAESDGGQGGGGAVSIEYQTTNGTVLGTASAKGGYKSTFYMLPGASGSVYVKSTADDLGVLKLGPAPTKPTRLPSLGSGTAGAGSSGPLLVTDLTAVSPYFVGHWIELRDPDGNLKGYWRIRAIHPGATATLELEPDANVAGDDQWRGVYRFSEIDATTGGTQVESDDPILIGPDAVPFGP